MVLIETAYYPYYDGDKIAASRVEAWEFLIGGGAAFMHLNGLYSTFNAGAAGTENNKLLGQLKILKKFIYSFDFWNMQQDHSFLAGGIPPGCFSRAISEPGKQYAFYIHHSKYGCWFWEPMSMGSCYNVIPGDYQENLVFSFEPGTYIAEWIDPSSGAVTSSENFTHTGGTRIIKTPRYKVDIALRMKSTNQ